MKTLKERFWNSDQSWHYQRDVRLDDGRTLRVTIRRNSYDFQSYLRGYLLTAAHGWQQLIFEPMESRWACFSVSYVNKDPDRWRFEADADCVLTDLIELTDSLEQSS